MRRRSGSGRWPKSLLSLPALSVRQPYAWLIVNGMKDIENRSWRTHKRGLVLIHASMNEEFLGAEIGEECEALAGRAIPTEYDMGGIVGVAELVNWVRSHKSVWKQRGYWGWVFANARPLSLRDCKGAVGFFYPKR